MEQIQFDMDHRIASLIHLIAFRSVHGDCVWIGEIPHSTASIEAIAAGLVEQSGTGLDGHWLRLTTDGQKLADESLAIMRALNGGIKR